MLENFESMAIIHVPNGKGADGTQINLIFKKNSKLPKKKSFLEEEKIC
jgi:hypothetical protein